MAAHSEQTTDGLSTGEAKRRIDLEGTNALPEQASEPVWHRFARQFQSPLIYILLFALAVDLGSWAWEGAHGVPVETIVIGLILFLNAALGTWQESKAEQALARLKTLAAPVVWVLRDANWNQLPASQLARGDVVRIEAGDRVPADGLVQSAHVAADESILTGESMPVEKEEGAELFSGTLIVRGKAYLRVTRTGPRSALGKLAELLGKVKAEPTPLEKDIRHFGGRIARVVLVIAALVVIHSIATQGLSRIGESFLFAVALAVAAVPEGLPAVLTLTLALGVERMAARKAVVRKLASVETLGSVTTILTDKTGTLTLNRIEVKGLDAPDPRAAMLAMMLANDADQHAGDPIDVALIDYALAQGLDTGHERANHPRVSMRPFDSQYKFMRTTVQREGQPYSFLKGAPEVLLDRCDLPPAERQSWRAKAEQYASQGFRVLGLAGAPGETEDGLSLLGLAMLWDPPRPEVPAAIQSVRKAGIRILMVTGDHPATALAIARLTGIEGERVVTGPELEAMPEEDLSRTAREVNLYARVRPEQKLKLVQTLQAQGEIVAMTGDGVNDAPALKRAEAGIAMGQRGSDVAREVADLVLLDDNFATIAAAIEEGRGVYENIQKFLRFLFSTNLSEVIVIGVGLVLAASLNLHEASGAYLLPLTAVQILWINLVTDSLPAISLAFDRNPGVMSEAPRPPAAPLLDTASIRFILSSGAIKAILALCFLATAQTAWADTVTARTAAFHFMAIGQLLFAYPSRHTRSRPVRNRILDVAVVSGIGIQLAVGLTPWPRQILGLAPLPGLMWAAIFAAALLAVAIAEALNRTIWANRPPRLQ